MIRLLIPILIAAVIAYVSWRMSLARMKRDLDANSSPLNDPKLTEAIKRLGDAVGVENLRARVYRMDAVNGLATPDGRIFITSALYDRYRMGTISADEIASVLAHELGHVARGHLQRRMIEWTGQNAAKMALGMILNRFLPFIGFYIANFLVTLFQAKFSRRDEFEADEYASALMLKAELGLDPQIAMFEKLLAMSPGRGGVAWLQSHPPVEERIAAIRARAEKWGARIERR